MIKDEEYTNQNNEDEEQLSVVMPEEVEVVGVRFKKSGKIYYFDPCGIKFDKKCNVLVRTARGVEYGQLVMTNTVVKGSTVVPPLRQLVRECTPADEERYKANQECEKEALKLFSEKIQDHNLDMKPVDVEYTFDNNRLVFYFTSDGRVDFRELVKDLASVFKTRIELRQIGIRDETKLLGGLGACGRPYCCACFLSDFSQVSIKMAKEQNLSLNSSKISGACGKLMCCLKYESESYEAEFEIAPKVGEEVKTVDGQGIVEEVNVISQTVKVKLISEPDKAPKSYKIDQLNENADKAKSTITESFVDYGFLSDDKKSVQKKEPENPRAQKKQNKNFSKNKNHQRHYNKNKQKNHKVDKQ